MRTILESNMFVEDRWFRTNSINYRFNGADEKMTVEIRTGKAVQMLDGTTRQPIDKATVRVAR